MLLCLAFTVSAEEPLPEAITQAITQQLTQVKPDVVITSITTSPISGLYKVTLENSNQVIFSDKTGGYFIAGDMYKIDENNLINLQKEERIINLLSQIDLQDMIIYRTQGVVKNILYIFTDVDCPYCVKLHQEIPSLTQRGIEIRYLAYPRSGLYSPAFTKLAAAWCSADPHETLSKLQQGGYTNMDDDCDDRMIEEQYVIGNQIGVNGTPSIVLPNGKVISGYHSAEELIALLHEDNKT